MKTPVADLLDIKFTADGLASDVSDAQQNVIIEDPDGALDVQWSDLYQTYEARFANTWAGNAESYIKIDYFNNNWYKERLADGHTIRRPCSRLTTLLLSKTQKQNGFRQWKPEVQDSLLLL